MGDENIRRGDSPRSVSERYQELRSALDKDKGENLRAIADATANALESMAEAESAFTGECRREVPFGQLFSVFLPDGSIEMHCTHEPPHVETAQ